MVEQKNRRWLVTAMYLIIFVAIMAAVLAYPHFPVRYAGLILQWFVVLILGVVWRILRELVGEMEMIKRPAKLVSLGVSSKPEKGEPDERDIAVRNTAYFRAYRVLAYYSILSFFTAGALMESSTMTKLVRLGAAEVLFFVLLMMATTLPQAILLWTEPDVPV